VSELDAIDGSPVLDIKPVMVECLPREEVRRPACPHELMREYWLRRAWSQYGARPSHRTVDTGKPVSTKHVKCWAAPISRAHDLALNAIK